MNNNLMLIISPKQFILGGVSLRLGRILALPSRQLGWQMLVLIPLRIGVRIEQKLTYTQNFHGHEVYSNPNITRSVKNGKR